MTWSRLTEQRAGTVPLLIGVSALQLLHNRLLQSESMNELDMSTGMTP